MKQKLTFTDTSSSLSCAGEMCLCFSQDTQQILTCWVCNENRSEPRSDVGLRRWCFISIPKHFAIPMSSPAQRAQTVSENGWTPAMCEGGEDKTRKHRGEWKRWGKLTLREQLSASVKNTYFMIWRLKIPPSSSRLFFAQDVTNLWSKLTHLAH